MVDRADDLGPLLDRHGDLVPKPYGVLGEFRPAVRGQSVLRRLTERLAPLRELRGPHDRYLADAPERDERDERTRDDIRRGVRKESQRIVV